MSSKLIRTGIMGCGGISRFHARNMFQDRGCGDLGGCFTSHPGMMT